MLVLLAVPQVAVRSNQEEMTDTLKHARQLQVATQMMALDGLSLAGDQVVWTSMEEGKGKSRAISLKTYFDAITREGYLSEPELRKILTAPGRGPGGEG